MRANELRILAEASKLLARTEYRKDASRLNAIITMEGGDPLTLCTQVAFDPPDTEPRQDDIKAERTT